jgi:hypothetical protein
MKLDRRMSETMMVPTVAEEPSAHTEVIGLEAIFISLYAGTVHNRSCAGIGSSPRILLKCRRGVVGADSDAADGRVQTSRLVTKLSDNYPISRIRRDLS